MLKKLVYHYTKIGYTCSKLLPYEPILLSKRERELIEYINFRDYPKIFSLYKKYEKNRDRIIRIEETLHELTKDSNIIDIRYRKPYKPLEYNILDFMKPIVSLSTKEAFLCQQTGKIWMTLHDTKSHISVKEYILDGYNTKNIQLNEIVDQLIKNIPKNINLDKDCYIELLKILYQWRIDDYSATKKYLIQKRESEIFDLATNANELIKKIDNITE